MIDKNLRKILLSLLSVPEPAYRMCFPFNREACIEYWNAFYKIPAGRYSHLVHSTCSQDRQACILLDCHGDPFEPTDEPFMGELTPIYYPGAAWAEGKYRIRERRPKSYEEGALIPLHDVWDIKRGCCPPGWLDEILGTEETPD